MANIYFICGFIGSGKTTYAKSLESEKNAYRFSIDEWMIPLYGEHMEREVFDARLETVQGLFKQSALRLIELGVPVIFDFGFWYQKERIAYLDWAKQHNLECELHFLDVPFETCAERAYARNQGRGEAAYEMTPEMMEMFWSWFEVPTSDETIKRIQP